MENSSSETQSKSSPGDCHTSLTLTGQKPEKVELEDVLHELGVMGRYQVMQIIFSCSAIFPFSIAMLNFVFIGYESPHVCNDIELTDILDERGLLNDSSAIANYDSCHIDVTSNETGVEQTIASLGCLNGYNYSMGKHASLVTEWDLVCEKLSVGQLVQSFFTLGGVVGTATLTTLADRYGRKYMFMVCSICLVISEFGLAFAPNIFVAIACRFISGLMGATTYLIHFVVNSELIVSKYRQTYGAVYCIIWSCTLLLMSAGGYFLQDNDWRILQLVTASICVPAVIVSFFINETPAWCFAKGRYEDARKILRNACKLNGKDFERVQYIFQLNVKQARRQQHEQEQKDILNHTSESKPAYSLTDIFRHKFLFFRVLVLLVIWFTISVTYYCLFLSSSTLAGNRFLNLSLMSALEIPSCLVYMIILMYLGRRTVVMLFFGLSGSFLLVSTILVGLNLDSIHSDNATTAFFLLGKFAIGSCFNVVFAYTPELFPTTMRSSGYGFCSSAGRLGGVIAPFTLPLFKLVAWAPGTIITALCFICMVLVPSLPETRGRQLPTTIEETRAWSKTIKQENKRPIKEESIRLEEL